jgi:hypothetical protein
MRKAKTKPLVETNDANEVITIFKRREEDFLRITDTRFKKVFHAEDLHDQESSDQIHPAVTIAQEKEILKDIMLAESEREKVASILHRRCVKILSFLGGYDEPTRARISKIGEKFIRKIDEILKCSLAKMIQRKWPSVKIAQTHRRKQYILNELNSLLLNGKTVAGFIFILHESSEHLRFALEPDERVFIEESNIDFTETDLVLRQPLSAHQSGGSIIEKVEKLGRESRNLRTSHRGSAKGLSASQTDVTIRQGAHKEQQQTNRMYEMMMNHNVPIQNFIDEYSKAYFDHLETSEPRLNEKMQTRRKDQLQERPKVSSSPGQHTMPRRPATRDESRRNVGVVGVAVGEREAWTALLNDRPSTVGTRCLYGGRPASTETSDPHALFLDPAYARFNEEHDSMTSPFNKPSVNQLSSVLTRAIVSLKSSKDQPKGDPKGPTVFQEDAQRSVFQSIFCALLTESPSFKTAVRSSVEGAKVISFPSGPSRLAAHKNRSRDEHPILRPNTQKDSYRKKSSTYRFASLEPGIEKHGDSSARHADTRKFIHPEHVPCSSSIRIPKFDGVDLRKPQDCYIRRTRQTRTREAHSSSMILGETKAYGF